MLSYFLSFYFVLSVVLPYRAVAFRFYRESFKHRNERTGLVLHSEIGRLEESIVDNSRDQPLQQLILRFNCDDIDSEEISELLFEVGTLSVSVEVVDEKSEFLNDEKNWADLIKTKSWANALLRAQIPATFDKNGLRDVLQTAYPNNILKIEFEDVLDIDWVESVQQDWKPQLIGNLLLTFPWHKEEQIEALRSAHLIHNDKQTKLHELVLEGGAAFGTGDHPTTRLCCRWLERSIASSLSGKQQNKGPSILDYGCGSAILGLAALRFGAGSSTGTDIDRDAILSARNNCKMNLLDMEFYLESDSSADEESTTSQDEYRSVLMNKYRGSANNPLSSESSHISSVDLIVEQNTDGVYEAHKQYDLTVANILAPILIILAPKLFALTRAGGKIALSGIIDKQANVVIEAFQKYFHDVGVEEQEEGWVLITGSKPLQS